MLNAIKNAAAKFFGRLKKQVVGDKYPFQSDVESTISDMRKKAE